MMRPKEPALPRHPAGPDVPLLVDYERQRVNVGDDFEVKESGEADAGAQLHEKIADGEGRPAIPAAATQNPVTEQRDVVVPPNRLKTASAMGRRPDDALFQRQPGDANIEQAADAGPDDERPERPEDYREVDPEGDHDERIAETTDSGDTSSVATVK